MLKITLELEANKLQNIEKIFLQELFSRFKKDFSNCEIVGLNQKKVIRFPLMRFWFKNWRFNKREADYIIRKWVELSLCTRIPYVGVKIGD